MPVAKVVVTVNVAVFREVVRGLEVLLVLRGDYPYIGQWALPGGALDEQDRTLGQAVRRELREEVGLEVGMVQEVDVFGDVGRDPRGRSVGVLYVALLDVPVEVRSGSGVMDAQWFSVALLPSPLAFDHSQLLRQVIAFVYNVWDLL